jgi:hypothetical protein
MGVGGQQAKRRKAGLRLPFSGVSAYVLWGGIQQPAREREGCGKRRWRCVRVLEAGASKRQMVSIVFMNLCSGYLLVGQILRSP